MSASWVFGREGVAALRLTTINYIRYR